MKEIISPIAHKAISILTEKGFNAFLVGGFIRQSIIGEGSSDIDICTDAIPSDIISVFSSFKIIETGIKHGTVTVFIEDIPVEITTFRIDGDYEKNRKPKAVSFTSSLTDDLKRRDFTMNAIAYNSSVGIIDPFCGRRDIENKIIRCVGDANVRFKEDALRILRAMRFSSVLGFKTEKNTKEAIFNNYHLLSNISKERITCEILKLFEGKYFREALFEFNEVFTFLFENEKLYEDTADDDNLYVKLARCNSLKYLSLPSKTIRLIDGMKKPHADSESTILEEITLFGDEILMLSLLYRKKYDLLPFYNEIIKNNVCRSISMLDINGDHLIKLGFQGEEIGEKLSEILNAVIHGKIKNKQDEIIRFIKK